MDTCKASRGEEMRKRRELKNFCHMMKIQADTGNKKEAGRKKTK